MRRVFPCLFHLLSSMSFVQMQPLPPPNSCIRAVACPQRILPVRYHTLLIVTGRLNVFRANVLPLPLLQVSQHGPRYKIGCGCPYAAVDVVPDFVHSRVVGPAHPDQQKHLRPSSIGLRHTSRKRRPTRRRNRASSSSTGRGYYRELVNRAHSQEGDSGDLLVDGAAGLWTRG